MNPAQQVGNVTQIQRNKLNICLFWGSRFLTISRSFPFSLSLSLSLPFLSPLFPSHSAPSPPLSLSLSLSLSLPFLSPLFSSLSAPPPLPLSLKAVYALEFIGNRPSKLCCIGMCRKFWHQILRPILFLLHLDFASWLPSFLV